MEIWLGLSEEANSVCTLQGAREGHTAGSSQRAADTRTARVDAGQWALVFGLKILDRSENDLISTAIFWGCFVLATPTGKGLPNPGCSCYLGHDELQ